MDHALNEPPQILGKCPVLVSAVKDSPALRAVAWYQNPSIGDLCTMGSYKIFYTSQVMFIFSLLRVVTCQEPGLFYPDQIACSFLLVLC